MKIMKKLFFFAAVAATLVACSSSDPAQEAPKNDTIRLTTSVAGQTRSTSQTLQGTQIANGSSVWVEMSYDGTATNTTDWGSGPYENKAAYTADGAGVLNGATVKWPVTGDEAGKIVTAEAWAPATAKLTAFTVKSDQTAEADYIASDFLYGKTRTAGYSYTDVVTNGDPIEIKFAHKLAKVNVTISAATNAAGAAIDPTGAKIEFGPSVLGASIGANGNVTKDASAAATIVMTSALEAAKTASAIMIPQEIAAGQLLKITIGTGTTAAVYVYSLSAAKTFDAGKVYTYTLSLRGDGSIIVLNEKIDDWEAGTTETITATKQ